MRNRRRNFTLVELLVVIGIIAILAGMLMAGIMYAPAKAQKAKAQAEITTLMNAIKQYESAYGVLPIPSGALSKDGTLGEDDYKLMIHILQADSEGLSSSADKEKVKKQNKRSTKFLDIQGNEPGVFTDPWDEKYNVVFDADYDGKITIDKDDTVKLIPGVNIQLKDNKYTYRFSVIIWCKGNDRKSSSTASNKVNEDNVYSFPTTWSSDTGHNISK